MVPLAERLQFPGPLLIRIRCSDTSWKAALSMKVQHEGALTHLCIIWKNGQVTHTARQVACHLENNSRGKRSPILEKRRGLTLLYQHAGTLRSELEMERNTEVLLQLEMSPSYIPPNAEESREAPPNCTVSLTSQRHSEKLPEVAGTSQGNPGFYAVTRERPRESFFNPS